MIIPFRATTQRRNSSSLLQPLATSALPPLPPFSPFPPFCRLRSAGVTCPYPCSLPYALCSLPTFPSLYSFSLISLTFGIVFRSIFDDIRYQFQSGNTITRLIIVNVAVFLALMLVQLVFTLGSGFNPQHGTFSEGVSYLFLSEDLLWH